MTRRSIRAGWCLLVVLLFVVAPVRAQEPGVPVGDVVLLGEVGISHELLAKNLVTQPGVLFSDMLIDEDLRWLANQHGIVATVVFEPGNVVVFRLARVGLIDEVILRGNGRYGEDELLDTGRLKNDSAITLEKLTRARDLIRDRYLRGGHAFVEVELGALRGGDGAPQSAEILVFEGPQVETVGVEINGLTALPTDSALDVLRSVPGFLDWFLGKDFVRSIVNEDVVLLENFVRGQGYLDARVGLDDLVFNETRDEVILRLFVEEGDLYSVGAISVEGNDTIVAEELLAEAALLPGGAYKRPDLIRTLRVMNQEYSNAGFIDRVVIPRETFALDSASVDITFVVQEGEQKRIRDVVVRGNTGTKDEVIRRYLTMYPGDVVDASELRYSEEKLIQQGFFTDADGLPRVRVDTEPTDDPSLVDVVVEVQEDRAGLFEFLIAAGSDGGVVGGVTINKNNFDLSRAASSWDNFLREFFVTGEAYHGGGQRLNLELLPGTEVSRFNLSLRDPYLDPSREDPWGRTIELYQRRRIFDDYDLETRGIGLRYDHSLDRNTRIWIGGRIEESDIDDVDFTVNAQGEVVTDVPTIFDDRGTYQDHQVDVGWRRADLDSQLEPTQGSIYSASVGLSGGPLGGDVDAVRVTGTGEWYSPISENDEGETTVLHTRFAIASTEPFSNEEDFPFTENNFAGGSSGAFAVRGFDFRGVGPHESGTAIGGQLAMAGSIEAVFPLHSTYNAFRDENETIAKGVLFLDFGNVQPESTDFGDLPTDLRISAGVGARMRLPALGGVTIALDLATVLADESGDETRAFSFELSRRF